MRSKKLLPLIFVLIMACSDGQSSGLISRPDVCDEAMSQYDKALAMGAIDESKLMEVIGRLSGMRVDNLDSETIRIFQDFFQSEERRLAVIEEASKTPCVRLRQNDQERNPELFAKEEFASLFYLYPNVFIARGRFSEIRNDLSEGVEDYLVTLKMGRQITNSFHYLVVTSGYGTMRSALEEIRFLASENLGELGSFFEKAVATIQDAVNNRKFAKLVFESLRNESLAELEFLRSKSPETVNIIRSEIEANWNVILKFIKQHPEDWFLISDKILDDFKRYECSDEFLYEPIKVFRTIADREKYVEALKRGIVGLLKLNQAIQMGVSDWEAFQLSEDEGSMKDYRIDPFSGKKFVLRVRGKDAIDFYSVGIDGDDDLGSDVEDILIFQKRKN